MDGDVLWKPEHRVLLYKLWVEQIDEEVLVTDRKPYLGEVFTEFWANYEKLPWRCCCWSSSGWIAWRVLLWTFVVWRPQVHPNLFTQGIFLEEQTSGIQDEWVNEYVNMTGIIGWTWLCKNKLELAPCFHFLHDLNVNRGIWILGIAEW